MTDKEHSDGSSADYYKLPEGSTQLQDLISHRDMNAQMGEIFRACYRYGLVGHSSKLRDAKKIKFYIEAEIARLEKLEKMLSDPNVPEEAPLTHGSALEAIKIEGAKLFKPGFCGHGETDWRNCHKCIVGRRIWEGDSSFCIHNTHLTMPCKACSENTIDAERKET